MSLIKEIGNFLGLEEDEIGEVVSNAPRSYKRYVVRKKNGGSRFIYHPSKETKALQYAFMELYLKKLPVHESAIGYRRGISSPLRKNAEIHGRYRYSVRVDFEEFFPSIKPRDLFSKISSSNKFTNIEQRFIRNILFIERKTVPIGLAIGSPASPLVSNIVMYSIDQHLSSYALQQKGAYTRYADDCVYSTNKKGDCQKFITEIRNVLRSTKSPKLHLNDEKTILTSRGRRRVVTGLFVCPDGKISIGRKNKRYIKKLIYDLSRGNLKESDALYLRGYLAFIYDVEPEFYNRLSIKYGANLIDKASRETPGSPTE